MSGIYFYTCNSLLLLQQHRNSSYIRFVIGAIRCCFNLDFFAFTNKLLFFLFCFYRVLEFLRQDKLVLLDWKLSGKEIFWFSLYKCILLIKIVLAMIPHTSSVALGFRNHNRKSIRCFYTQQGLVKLCKRLHVFSSSGYLQVTAICWYNITVSITVFVSNVD